MRYVFMAYRDQERWNALSATERARLELACRASEDELRQTGLLSQSTGLESGRQAVSVRMEAEGLSIFEGSGAATSENIVRIFEVEARDLNQAIQAAARMPQARMGPIEVRAVHEPGNSQPWSATQQEE